MASGNRLVVTGDKKFRIIDISVPTKPVIQLTTNLPNKGFFSIFRFLSLKNFIIQADAGRVNFGKVLSTTPLQASKSISIAVGKQHAYVLTMPPEKEK